MRAPRGRRAHETGTSALAGFSLAGTGTLVTFVTVCDCCESLRVKTINSLDEAKINHSDLLKLNQNV